MNTFEQQTPSTEDEFERKKKRYFSKLALSFRTELRIHRDVGLWERNQSGAREWGNVSEHCLVEGARIGVLADRLSLSRAARKDLVSAAVLHDFYKRNEVESMREAAAQGRSLHEASISSDHEAKRKLEEAQIPSHVIRLVGSVGNHPETLFGIKAILDKEELTEEDISILVMHYIDDYTKGDAWATPVETDGRGNRINDIDRRIHEAAGRYAKKMEEDEVIFGSSSDSFFHNKKSQQIILEVAHMVEGRLAELIRERSGEPIDPLELPEAIDKAIRESIEREVLQ